MPIQCQICLCTDTDETWSSVASCGHVFHTVCITQEIEHRRRCPICRKDVPKRGEPLRPVFFHQTDEADGGQAGGGGDGIDSSVINAAQLQMKLLVKEQQLQALKVEAEDSSRKIQQLEDRLKLAQKSLRKKDDKLSQSVAELAQLNKQHKQTSNELSNLRLDLQREQTVASRIRLVNDATLRGEALQRELSQLLEQDITVPSWFAGMLEVRNKQISEVTNKVQQLERQKQQAEGHLKHEIHKLELQVARLQQQLEQQPAVQQAAEQPVPQGRHGMALGGGEGAFEEEEQLGGLDYVPAPRNSNLAPGSKPSLRQRMQRLTGRALPGPSAGSEGTAAAAAGPSRLPSIQQQQQQQQAASPSLGQFVTLGANGVAGSGQEPRAAVAAAAAPAAAAHDGVAVDEEGDFVLLEGSEEQQQQWREGEPGQAEAYAVQADDGAYSEIESEDELEILEGGGPSHARAQQGQQQQQQQGRQGGVWREGHRVDLVGSLLGKRHNPEEPAQQQQQQQQQQQVEQVEGAAPGWQASAGGGSADVGGSMDEPGSRALRPSNRAGYNPLPLKAGPSRLGGGGSSGPSFLRDAGAATTGLDDKAKFIQRGPDGRGGQVSFLRPQQQPGSSSGARPKALQQTQLRPQAVQPAAAGGACSKKQKGKSGWGGGAANGGCTIDLFFNRAAGS